MIKAIVYVSNTGNTRRYAELISGKTGLPAYPLGEAGKHVKSRAEEIFYMGWVQQGKIKSFARAAMKFNVAGACGVGLVFPAEQRAGSLREKTGITDPKIKVFYAQGGFDMNKLTGFDKLMMMAVLRAMRGAEGKERKGEPIELDVTAEMLEKGADCVSEENIAPVVEWIIKRNRLMEQALAEDGEKA